MVHRSAEQMRTASVNYMVDRKSSISDGYPAGVASPAASSDGNLALALCNDENSLCKLQLPVNTHTHMCIYVFSCLAGGQRDDMLPAIAFMAFMVPI